MQKRIRHGVKLARKIITNIWFFPAVLTIILATLTTLGIHGSSIGIYHYMFYGESVEDSDLLANKPQSIRSDEWIVTSQKTIAQNLNNFDPINKNIGLGEDQTLLADVPSRDTSTIFKPHNLGFLALPFENAFALRWWSFLYLLLLSCYLFILALLPGRSGLAALISLGFAFSPFFHWWYTFGTFASVYYCLFAIVLFTKLLRSTTWRKRAIYSLLLSYIATSFALILYPPFQIPALLASVAFCSGYIANYRQVIGFDRSKIRNVLICVLAVLIITGVTLAAVLYQKQNIISTITNTDYPGQRTVQSGGYDLLHLAASHTGILLQSAEKASAYQIPKSGAVNQSESSNFILITSFLLLPALFFFYGKRWLTNRLLVAAYVCMGVFIAWMVLPLPDALGKVVFLDKVPHTRLVIGLGVLNLFVLAGFAILHSKSKERIARVHRVIYSLLCLTLLLLINFYLLVRFPGFMSYKWAVVLSLAPATIIYLLLSRWFKSAFLLLAVLSFLSVYRINPLYSGVEVLTETPLSHTIREIGESSDKRWVSEDIYLENFVALNGEPSLTGTYLYPHLALWDQLGDLEKRSYYNRYAHTNFTFDRQLEQLEKPTLRQPGVDQLNIHIEPCDQFFHDNDVGFLLTSVEFEPGAISCGQLIKEVEYPQITYYIYTLQNR